MLAVSLGFAAEEGLSLVGAFEDDVVVNIYSSAPELELTGLFTQPGELVDARVYNGVLHIVSLSDTLPDEIDITVLPDSSGGVESCVITALDLDTLDYARHAFSGANGAIQLGDSTVVINYDGLDENGESVRCFAPVFLDGMEIELGAIN
jgi:hypothetical protein